MASEVFTARNGDRAVDEEMTEAARAYFMYDPLPFVKEFEIDDYEYEVDKDLSIKILSQWVQQGTYNGEKQKAGRPKKCPAVPK